MFGFGESKKAITPVLGLNLSQDGVAIARLDDNDNRLISLCSFTPCNSSTEWINILQELVNRFSLQGVACRLVLDPDDYQMFQVQKPDVDDHEIAQSVRWRLQELLDFPAEEAIVDVFEQPVSPQSGEAMLYAVVARESKLKPLVDLVFNAGLQLVAIDITDLAMLNISARLNQDDDGIIMLYLLERFGLIAILREKTLFISRQIGSENDSDAPTVGIVAWTKENLDITMTDEEPVASNVLLECRRSLQYFQDYFNEPSLQSIMMVSNLNGTDTLLDSLNHELGMTAQHLDLNTILSFNDLIDIHTQTQCFAAIGTALHVDAEQMV